MSRPLKSISIAAPAILGINTQSSSVNLQDGFALQADNCIIDKFGRLGSRKGWDLKTDTVKRTSSDTMITGTVTVTADVSAASTTIGLTTAADATLGLDADDKISFGTDPTLYTIATGAHNISAGTTGNIVLTTGVARPLVAGESINVANILGMHHFIDFTGTKTTISWSATQFYTGYTTLTALDVTGASAQSLSTGNWMAATLNDLAYFFQEGYRPLVYDPVAGTLKPMQDLDFTGVIVDTGNGAGIADEVATNIAAIPQGGFVMSAFGRLWVAKIGGTTGNKTKVYFSDVNDGRDWTQGLAGVLDIASVFPKGTDQITGLATQNGALVILCRNSIVIYDDQVNNFNDTITVTNLTLADIIYGVGCIAAKTIVNTGEDVLFLDSTGVRSLGRTIQEKSRPMRDVSMNVRDDLLDDVVETKNTTNVTIDEITAIYSPIDGFYLLSFPTRKKAYCFDTKGILQDGSFRVTTWSDVPHISYAFDPLSDVINIVGAAGIAEYDGYTDYGLPYPMTYYTNHFDMGDASVTKILKKVGLVLLGSNAQSFNIKVSTDYQSRFETYPHLGSASASISQYGISEYNIAEYSSGIALENIALPVGGSGTVLQVGFETIISGQILSLQKLNISTKIGRML